MTTTLDAWYFSTQDEMLRYGDNRPIAVGASHAVEGTPVLCRHGLHASVRLIDALRYAPGSILWRVRLSGVIVEGDDKVCATERTYLARLDATDILREFARICALDVSHLWDMPDVVRDFLVTGNPDIAAYAAAAAADATYAAAAAAAADAAANSAYAAAYAAGAGAAVVAKQDQRLTEMVSAALSKDNATHRKS